MSRLWSLMALATLIFGVLTFALAPSYGMWLPQDVSSHGRDIDSLFYFILILTGVVFIATEGVMFYFMWKYEAHNNKEPVAYSHGSHTLEIVWTIIPSATLLFIALYQFNTWLETKRWDPRYGADGKMTEVLPTVEVSARQWEWRLRYPGEDGKIGTPDDLYSVNELHVPVGTDSIVLLKSSDVLHSFFIPEMRVKQDAVPGMTIPVWFKALKKGSYDLVCAEHCGARHYAMKGVIVVESPEEYAEYLHQLGEENHRTKLPPEALAKGDTQ